MCTHKEGQKYGCSNSIFLSNFGWGCVETQLFFLLKSSLASYKPSLLVSSSPYKFHQLGVFWVVQNICQDREIIDCFPFLSVSFYLSGEPTIMWPSKKRCSCTIQALFKLTRHFVSAFCLTSQLAFSSLSFKNTCAYEGRGMMQCLSQQGPPEIATLHTEALLLSKVLLGRNREIGHADAIGWQDCRVRDHNCNPELIEKKRSSQVCVLGRRWSL